MARAIPEESFLNNKFNRITIIGLAEPTFFKRKRKDGIIVNVPVRTVKCQCECRTVWNVEDALTKKVRV